MPERRVVVDVAGARMGGAARFLRELDLWLERARRPDVEVIGRGRPLTPRWLVERELLAAGASDLVALNNVSFCRGPARRTVLLRNALHFPQAGERSELRGVLDPAVRAQATVVRVAARRAHRLVVPTQGMAGRVAARLPGLAGRLVVRPHPLAPPPPAPSRPGSVLCPVLFAGYKRMDDHLALLLAAASALASPGLRVLVTAEEDEVDPRLRRHPLLGLLGRLPVDALDDELGRAQVVYYPTTLESFGYPIAEARALGRPLLAPVGSPAAEVAGPCWEPYTPGDSASLRSALERALARRPVPDPAPFDPDAYFTWLLS